MLAAAPHTVRVVQQLLSRMPIVPDCLLPLQAATGGVCALQVVLPDHPRLATLLMSRHVSIKVLQQQLGFLQGIEAAGGEPEVPLCRPARSIEVDRVYPVIVCELQSNARREKEISATAGV